MTKKELFEENHLNLLNQAKAELSDIIRKIITKTNEANDSDETHILLHEFGVSQPIYREDTQNDEMSETISSAWTDSDGNIGFEVDTFDSGYDITMHDLNMDMVLYLLGEFEDVEM